MPIETHAAPAFKVLAERAAVSDVDRDDLRRLVQALRDWRVVVDGRLDQAQLLRGRIVVVEEAIVDLRNRVVVLEAAVQDLSNRVAALEIV